MYASPVPKRRHFPFKTYGNPTSSFYDGRVHSYIESRHKVYVPEYADLIRGTRVLAEIRAILDEGTDVLILDNDAPPKTERPEGREMTQALWDAAIDDPALPFGHGYVVAGLLANLKVPTKK